MAPLPRCALFFAVLLGACVLTAPAAAQAVDVRSAARKFADGERAFRTGDYSHAAESFEAAYADAPHADALWNGARAWEKARELARAANLYARYLREAPPSAPDRNSATAAIERLSAKLGRIEVHAAGLDDVALDGSPVTGTDVFVHPGRHRATARRGEVALEQTVLVEAGNVVSVTFAPPAAPPPAAPAVAPSSSPASPEAAPPAADRAPAAEGPRWSPAIVWIGTGLTVAAAAVTTWSGLDTLAEKDAFIASPSQEELDRGRDKQLRTNVALGVTAGLATLTVLSALFLVEWRPRGANATVAAGPGSVVLRGIF